MAKKSVDSKIARSMRKSTNNSSIDIKSIEELQEETEWVVVNETTSKKCKYRIRKWRPVQNGWFCKLTNLLCLEENCLKRK